MGNFIFVAALLVSIWFMISRKSNLPDGQSVNDPLTRNEKILSWILCIFSPIVAGAILYYGWKKKLPIKAKQANKISFIALGITILIVIGVVIIGGFNAGSREKEYDARFQKAVQLISGKKFDEAQTILLELNKNIKSASLYYNLAITYEAQSNLKEAAEQLRKVLEIDPNNGKAKQYLADLQQKIALQDALKLVQDGKISEAKLRLLQIVDAQAPVMQIQVHLLLAKIYLQEKNSDEALRQLEAVLRIDANNQEAQQLLSKLKK